MTTYIYPLRKEIKCYSSDECFNNNVNAVYCFSRIHPWIKGYGYMDRYREPSGKNHLTK